VAELDWRIEAVATSLARAFEAARNGDLVFAGSWHGRAEELTRKLEDREVLARAVKLCDSTMSVLYGLDYERQRALAELAELKAELSKPRRRGGRRAS